MDPEKPGGHELPADEIARYSRHLTLPDVGLEGQLRLRSSSVLLVGAGGLGSPLGIYLAAAGVGRIGLVDFDIVDLSNLQRQVLYEESDVGRPKLDPARERLEAINPHVKIECHPRRLTADNAMEILDGYDVVVDGTDNFSTRYLVNDACVLLRKPNVYGSIFRFEGQVSVFWAGKGPCYRCLYPEPPPPGSVPTCAEGGVLGVLPGTIGTLQATEAIKLILGKGELLLGRLLLFDALEMRFRELTLRRDRHCPVCGDEPTIRKLVDCDATCDVAPEVAVDPPEIDPGGLARRLEEPDPPLLLDVRSPQEWAICHLDGASLIPLQELPQRLDELNPERETVVYCHVGSRSARATRLLTRRGFLRTRNLRGGIDAWSIEIDPSLPRY